MPSKGKILKKDAKGDLRISGLNYKLTNSIKSMALSKANGLAWSWVSDHVSREKKKKKTEVTALIKKKKGLISWVNGRDKWAGSANYAPQLLANGRIKNSDIIHCLMKALSLLPFSGRILYG